MINSSSEKDTKASLPKECNVIIHRNSDETVIGYVDGLFSCAAMGDSEECVLKQLKEKAPELLNRYETLGIPSFIGTDPLPSTDYVVVSVEYDDEDLKAIAEKAQERGVTINAIMIEMIEAFIESPELQEWVKTKMKGMSDREAE